MWGDRFEYRPGDINAHRRSKTRILQNWDMRDVDGGWTHVVKSKEVRVGKLLCGMIRWVGKFVLGKLLRCLATLIVQRYFSEQRWHEMIGAAMK